MKALFLLIGAAFFLSCAQVQKEETNLEAFKKRFPQSETIRTPEGRTDRTRGM